MDEAAGRAVVWQLGKSHNRDGAFLDRLCAAMVVEIRRGIPGARRVHLDLGVTKIIGEVDGEHVQCGLR